MKTPLAAAVQSMFDVRAQSGFVLDFVYKIQGVFKEFSRTRN